MSVRYEKLKKLLKELFQLDQPADKAVIQKELEMVINTVKEGVYPIPYEGEEYFKRLMFEDAGVCE